MFNILSFIVLVLVIFAWIVLFKVKMILSKEKFPNMEMFMPSNAIYKLYKLYKEDNSYKKLLITLILSMVASYAGIIILVIVFLKEALH